MRTPSSTAKALLRAMRVAIERPGTDRRRDEPDHDCARPGAGALHAGRLAASRRQAARRSTSTSTSSAPFSTTASRGRGSASCSARRARFQIWRRDVLEEVGGYSSDFTCEDIELTFRIHERFRREGRDYEIRCLPDNVGVTEGPDDVAKLVSQRERWQRVINETVVPLPADVVQPAVRLGRHGRRAVLPADRGALAGDRAARSRVARGGGRRSGSSTSRCSSSSWPRWRSSTRRSRRARSCSTTCSRGSIACATSPGSSFWAPFDMLLYRPIIAWARFKGSWRFLRGDKAWHKFERNVRAA